MGTHPVCQLKKGEWTSERYYNILGLKIPAPFTDDPVLLADYISNFQTRPGDVFVVSYPKSGTTWVQEIVWQMYNEGKISKDTINSRVPFLEPGTSKTWRQPDIVTLPSPRLIKSHLTFNTIPKSLHDNTQCKYIYVARNPKDVVVSYFYFAESLKPYGNGYNGPWEFFLQSFIEGNVNWNFWHDHVLGWWKHRDDPNVLFLKYEDMHKDLRSHVRMIADFLGKPLSDELINRIAEQCTFQGMAKNWACYTFSEKENGEGLLRKGVVADWKNHFTPEQNERFENEVLQKLSGSGLVFDLEI